MAKHVQGKGCQVCFDMSQHLHSVMRGVWGVVQSHFPDAHLSCTFRDEQSQKEAFDKGTSKLRWPKSFHNHMEDGKPASKAFDVFRLSNDGKAHFERDYYAKIAEYLADQKAPVDWGYALWKWDAPHFQLKTSEGETA